VREYVNEPGERAAATTDADAFAEACPASSGLGSGSAVLAGAPQAGWSQARASDGEAGIPAPRSAADPQETGCAATSTSLCVQDGRYEVTVDWSTLAGEFGDGKVASARTEDSGLFYFFAPWNWEMLVKVLDGCGFNDHHWVFAASATDVGFELTVRDTASGAVRKYWKEPGSPAPAMIDAAAFPESCRNEN